MKKGIPQGSSLSAKLYLVYISELNDTISSSGHGAIIVHLRIGCPIQDEDIARVSCSESAMRMKGNNKIIKLMKFRR